MDDMLADAARDVLREQCTAERVRAIEGADAQGTQSPGRAAARSLWEQLDALGFADALVPEDQGGAGLALDSVFEVWAAAGEHALPVPLGETMVARALLAEAGVPRPAGSIALAEGQWRDGGALAAATVTLGAVADHVLVQHPRGWSLLSADAAEVGPASFALDRSMSWSPSAVAAAAAPVVAAGAQAVTATAARGADTAAPAAAETAARPGSRSGPGLLRQLLACVVAVQSSGAMMEVFRRTLQYANDRTQFGRPIGKFQAIQHQLAVMSEEVFAARMAARLGTMEAGWRPDPLRIAIAKARTSEAARAVAEFAHSIHGAIGFTAEYDLQLFTRRLHAWRSTAGSESYWHAIAGRALVDQHQGSTLALLQVATAIED
jgi:acyl-CoA dehydrogenase